MEIREECRRIEEALLSYFGEIPSYCEPYGSGHINDTFLVVADRRYILQRMNHKIFPNPERLMENIAGVTAHICRKARKSGADPSKASLVVIPTREGKTFFRDSVGSYWRVYEFCEGTVSRDRVESPSDFALCGEGFGAFQKMLSDYPAETLYESIANFHNTPWRYENLMKAMETDACGRAASVKEELAFAIARQDFCSVLERAHAEGRLPLRVTHNDTKLNNILFDEKTGEPRVVIDLDTVMPGFSVTDFGDSIRFGANTAAEDETDLSLVSLDLSLFECYARGFLKGCGGELTEGERLLLPEGAIMMTLECGMRFLTDYLEGDIYFRIHRPLHNLERCRNQFALVADMERKLPEMRAIIRRLTETE